MLDSTLFALIARTICARKFVNCLGADLTVGFLTATGDSSADRSSIAALIGAILLVVLGMAIGVGWICFSSGFSSASSSLLSYCPNNGDGGLNVLDLLDTVGLSSMCCLGLGSSCANEAPIFCFFCGL